MTQLDPPTTTPHEPMSFGPVPTDDRPAAFRQLGLADPSMSDRLVRRKVRATEEAGLDLAYLWGAYDERARLAAAAWVVPQAGRTGMVFLSRPAGRRGVEVVGRLIDALCGRLDGERVAMAQALVMPTEDLHKAALERGGFAVLATLCYLQATVPQRVADPEPSPDIELLPYRPPLRPQFAAALEASYEQTLDCPALRGVRRTEDVIAGHMGAGRFDGDLWTLLRVAGEPAGVCLVNPVEESGCCELVYLGVAAPHRRRKLASLLLEHAKALCAQHGYGLVTLAVDEANAPAVRLYESHRFHRTARKVAMVRRIFPPAAAR